MLIKGRNMQLSYKKRRALFGMAYVAPSFILLLVFGIIPIFMSLYFSFTKYNVIKPAEWIGFENYARMFTDSYIGASIKNTIVYTFLTVPFQTAISLILAALIADKFRNRFGSIVKGALFIPVLASSILIGSIWSFLLAPTGLINNVLKSLGSQPVNWLGNKHLALVCVSFVAVWKNVGYFLVIFYAGIMDIPDTLYEAAKIDGANKAQSFFYITIPALRPITYLVVTLGTIWSFQVFDLVYTMTGGGPGLSTQTLVLTIYSVGFKSYEMGYASAISILLLGLVLLISFVQRKFMVEEN